MSNNDLTEQKSLLSWSSGGLATGGLEHLQGRSYLSKGVTTLTDAPNTGYKTSEPKPFKTRSPPNLLELQKEMTMGPIYRLMRMPGIQGVLLYDKNSMPIESTMKYSTTAFMAKAMLPLLQRCEHIIRDLEPLDDLIALRVLTTKHELLMCQLGEMVAVVQQKPFQVSEEFRKDPAMD